MLIAMTACEREQSTSRGVNQTPDALSDPLMVACFAAYVDLHEDLAKAYKNSGGSLSPQVWGYTHFLRHGKAEGRALPPGCAEIQRGDGPAGVASAAVSSASGSTSGATSATQPATTVASIAPPRYTAPDYQLVHRLNASFTGGKAVRWKSRSITLKNFKPTNIFAAVKPWEGFEFSHGESGIIYRGASDKFPGSCGWAIPYWYANYEFARCDIWINISTHTQGRCGSVGSTITHEVGHCLGILAHTSDGTLMDPKANGSMEISPDVRRMLDILYTMPLNSRVAASGSVSVGKELVDRGDMIEGETIFVMPEDKAAPSKKRGAISVTPTLE